VKGPLQGQTIELDHRAVFLRDAPAQATVIAASSDGHVTLIRDRSIVARTQLAAAKISEICLHPRQPLLAYSDERRGQLHVTTLDDRQILKRGSTRFRNTSLSSPHLGYSACFFGENGESLWCTYAENADSVHVEVYRVSDWTLASSVVVADPFGGSWCSFHPTSQPDMVALWLAAGQDGQQVVWLHWRGGKLLATLEPLLRDTTPPTFAPRGDEFLAMDGDYEHGIRKFRFPAVAELPGCKGPWAGEETFGYSLCYLDDTLALVSSATDRPFLLDVTSMTIIDELAIAGHEPRPAEEIYRQLVGDKELCTDLSYFARIGSDVVFVSCRDWRNSPNERLDDLIFVPVSTVREAVRI